MQRQVWLLLSLVLVLSAGLAQAATNRVIVKLNCACPEQLEQAGYHVVRTFTLDDHMFVVEPNLSVKATMKALKAMSVVKYTTESKPVHLLQHTYFEDTIPPVPPVPYSLALTEVDKCHQEGVTGTASVIVAVIDTGSSPDHPELKDKVLKGKNFVPTTPTDDATDDNGHGTHVSGTIAGNTVGFAPGVKILPVKFLDAQGSGTEEAALAAIDFAAAHGAKIMSNSWGGGGFNQAMLDLIKKAGDKGILFIAAAGNDASDNDSIPSYPASYQADNVVSVAASDDKDKPASFTNFGKTTVHVTAPGVGILSSYLNNTLKKLSGTSMATPAVSGTAALVLSVSPLLKPSEVRDLLVKHSTGVEVLKDTSVSQGRLNALDTVHAAQAE